MQELWEAQGVYSPIPGSPSAVEGRLAQLEQTVQQLAARVQRLEQ